MKNCFSEKPFPHLSALWTLRSVIMTKENKRLNARLLKTVEQHSVKWKIKGLAFQRERKTSFHQIKFLSNKLWFHNFKEFHQKENLQLFSQNVLPVPNRLSASLPNKFHPSSKLVSKEKYSTCWRGKKFSSEIFVVSLMITLENQPPLEYHPELHSSDRATCEEKNVYRKSKAL